MEIYPIANHSTLPDLAWLSSKHTGTASTIASFDSTGAATESGVLIDDSDNMSGIGTIASNTITVEGDAVSVIERNKVSDAKFQRALFLRRNTIGDALVAGDGTGLTFRAVGNGTVVRSLAAIDACVEHVGNKDGGVELKTADGNILKVFMSADSNQNVTFYGDVDVAGRVYVGDHWIGPVNDDLIIDVDNGGNLIIRDGELVTEGGRIVNTARLTSGTTLDSTHHHVFCDTDGGAFTVTLPASPTDGQTYRIINTGSSGNDITLDENGKSLFGSVDTETIYDGEKLIITYETTEGWW